MAATAPLFNKVLTDGTYRWTPDCIWFDDETVWYTPNYYVQQLYAKYLGNKVVGTSFTTYRNGERTALIPHGGIELAAGNAAIVVKHAKVTSNADGSVLLEQDFTKPLDAAWKVIPGSDGYTVDPVKGLVLHAQSSGLNGLYLLNEAWTNYKLEVVAEKIGGEDGFYVGAGLTDISPDQKDVIEYAIGYKGSATGVKVYKRGIEGYTLGDYSSSTAAGNLRASCYEALTNQTEYTITVDYGGANGKQLICSYTDGITTSKVLEYKLEAYNREIYNSVTKDDKHIYVKLVNADSVEKAIKLDFAGIKVTSAGKWVSLTGDSPLVHLPNVNKKNDEKIAPCEKVINVDNGTATITLAAHSVNVLILALI